MVINERVQGILLCLFAALIIWQAGELSSVPGTTYGPGLLPTMGGVALLYLGAHIFWKAHRAQCKQPLIDWRAWSNKGSLCIAALWTFAGVAAGFYLMPAIGFLLYGAVFMMGLMLIMGGRLLTTLIISTVTLGAAYYLFTQVFYVPLPKGSLPLPW